MRLLCGGTSWFNCQAPEALSLGLLLSAVGLGAITGAFLVASLPDKAPRGLAADAGNLTFPLFLILFVGSHSFLVSLLIMMLVGMSHVFQNAMANTLLQLTLPDDLRGRVMSLYSLVSHGMTHLGGLQAGFQRTGWRRRCVGAGGVVSLAYGLFVAFRYPTNPAG